MYRLRFLVLMDMILAAMFLSDLAIGLLSGNLSLGLHRLIPVVYPSFALIVCLGLWVRTRRTSCRSLGPPWPAPFCSSC